MSFAPHVLYRRGTLGVDAVLANRPHRTWELLAAADAARRRREELAGPVLQVLYDLVPDADQDQRAALLRLRRAVHNGAWPLPAGAAVAVSLLREWCVAREREHRLHEEAHRVYEGELRSCRAALARLAQHEGLRRGLQLSGRELSEEIARFAEDPERARKPSRRKRAESSVTSYAYRVALKPSPFGSFTEIGAVPWDGTVPWDGAGHERTCTVGGLAVTRLDVGLCDWVAGQVAERFPQVRHVWLNSTIERREDRVRLVARRGTGPAAFFSGEQVITTAAGPLLDVVEDQLRAGPLPEAELRRRLVGAGMAGDQAGRAVVALCRAGVLEHGLPVQDQDTQRLRTIAGLARTHAGEELAELEELALAEERFGTVDAPEREEVLRTIERAVGALAERLDVAPPAPTVLRSLVYEDRATRRPPSTWDPRRIEEVEPALQAYRRVLPILDEAVVEQLGLYRFTVDRCGLRPGRSIALLDLYASFRELSEVEAVAVMTGSGSETVASLRRLRGELLGWAHRLGGPGEDSALAEVRLDVADLEEWADAVPSTVPRWESMSARLQIDARHIVLNGVTAARGVFFSRFCELLRRPGGWDLEGSVRGHLARRFPRQADLTAVLGLNFNLHPDLAPFEVVYPGSVARRSDALGLSDLDVRVVEGVERLELVERRTGSPVELVPLNFLFPAAAPDLYRFLCTFAPTRTFRGGLWDHADASGLVARHRPRVAVAGLVVERRTWIVPAAALPDLAGVERQEIDALAGLARWLGQAGLPQQSFYRLQSATPGRPSSSTQARERALAAPAARTHKPHFFDPTDPFLAHVLAKQAMSSPEALLRVQECLPKPQAYTGLGHGAEEFLIEVYPEDGP